MTNGKYQMFTHEARLAGWAGLLAIVLVSNDKIN
jgi:hypothetical protein